MAKDTDISEKEDKQTEQRGGSIRDAIKAAVEEHTQEGNNEIKERTSRASDDSDRVRDTKSTDKSDEVEQSSKDKSEVREQRTETVSKQKDDKEVAEQVQEVKEVKAEQVEDKAPSILPKEVQAAWGSIPADVKNYVTKTQKELADIKAESGRKAQHYKEIDAAIAPYTQAIQSWGATPAQTVDRLFKWMDCLTGPHKYHYIQELAYNFGIDLDGLYAQKYAGQPQQQQTQEQNNQQNNQQTQQQQDYVDPRVAQAIEAMYEEVNQLKSTQVQQRQNSAANYVESWAGLQPDGTYKNKPYFSQVRQLMYGLLANGAVPLVNGQLDLDTAYENACYSNPEVRQLLLAQQAEDKQQKAIETRAKKDAEEKAKVARAKSANFSLKTASPSGNSSSVDANGRVRDNKTGQYKSTSVRDSIYAAMREVDN